MAARDDAYQDWKAGMKYREIAEKYAVSESTVKSWAARYWKNQDAKKVATKGKKKLQPSEKKLQPKKRGAPHGNKNASGSHPGAPLGNQNSVKHGFFVSSLSDEEKAVLAERESLSLEQDLEGELGLLGIRELRMMRRINAQETNPTGLAVQSVEKQGNKTTTKAITSAENVKDWESQLTQVQRTRIRGIINLNEMRVRRKLDGVAESDESNDDITMYEIPKNGRD